AIPGAALPRGLQPGDRAVLQEGAPERGDRAVGTGPGDAVDEGEVREARRRERALVGRRREPVVVEPEVAAVGRPHAVADPHALGARQADRALETILGLRTVALH